MNSNQSAPKSSVQSSVSQERQAPQSATVRLLCVERLPLAPHIDFGASIAKGEARDVRLRLSHWIRWHDSTSQVPPEVCCGEGHLLGRVPERVRRKRNAVQVNGRFVLMKADQGHKPHDSKNELSPRQTWSAVGSMALCVSMLIAAEFMPVSLLTTWIRMQKSKP